MPDQIRILRHKRVPQTGSFEVRFPDGRPSNSSTSMTAGATPAAGRSHQRTGTGANPSVCAGGVG